MRFFPTVCSIYIFCICSYFYSSQLTINHSNQFICLINSPRKIYSFWVRNIFYFLIPNLTWRIYFCLDSLLTISYGNNLEVAMGNTLKVSETQKLPDFHIAFNAEGEAEPTILTAGADSSSASTASVDSATFTLAVTDPDAPSRTDKAYSEYLHYLVTGLKLKAPLKTIRPATLPLLSLSRTEIPWSHTWARPSQRPESTAMSLFFFAKLNPRPPPLMATVLDGEAISLPKVSKNTPKEWSCARCCKLFLCSK